MEREEIYPVNPKNPRAIPPPFRKRSGSQGLLYHLQGLNHDKIAGIEREVCDEPIHAA
jgi:hypothetical protein